MYSVLIVDDEKMIRDDVYELLTMEEDLELDLVTSACAAQAQQIMEERKIDIAIMDIDMPQMSGLELFDIVRERWPHCKVIFLTGYSDFSFIYRVHKHAKYVLKGEEDENILTAVRETIAELENDLLLERLSGMRQKEPSVQYEREVFLRDVFNGYREVNQLTPETEELLDIPLELSKPIFYVLLRHEQWYQWSYREQKERYLDFCQLVERYFLDSMQGVFFEYDLYHIILLLQPKKLIQQTSVIRMLTGAGELFQKALKMNLSVSVAVLIGAEPLLAGQLVSGFKGIRDRAVQLDGEELTLYESKMDTPGSESLPESRKQELLQQVWKLEYYLEGMDEKAALDLLRRLQEEVQGIHSMHDLFVLEIYCTISSRLIGWIKRLGLDQEMAFRVGTMKLYNVSQHAGWKDAFGYLYHVAENIFALKNRNAEKQTEDAVNRVKKYIVEHLAEDTSLYTLAEQVHFSQEYLLRIFKKREGVTILQYINDLKLSAAKQLLTDSELTAKEIADRLGFASQGYFGRFFRSKTGMTPNAWREARQRGGGES